MHTGDLQDAKLRELTLQNHCTRTALSSPGGCSPQVHKIEYLAVNKGNILVNFLLLKIFIDYVLEFMLTFDKMQNTNPLMCTKFEI